jgi:hypothetical protein
MLPAQHCWPTPPHEVHVPGMPMPALRPVQTLVIVFVHVPLLPTPQHGPLSAPQVPHWLPPVATRQALGAVHMLPAQHPSPAPPQAVHMPGVPIPALRPVQMLVIVLVHVPLLPTPQQEPPRAPQVPHTLPPAPTSQASPPLHELAAPPPSAPPAGQQGAPSLPQGPQVPAEPPVLPVQNRPVWQFPPPQHAAPEAPHVDEHVPAVEPAATSQASPALHALFAQHASPEAPQVPQTLPPAPATQDRPPEHPLAAGP